MAWLWYPPPPPPLPGHHPHPVQLHLPCRILCETTDLPARVAPRNLQYGPWTGSSVWSRLICHPCMVRRSRRHFNRMLDPVDLPPTPTPGVQTHNPLSILNLPRAPHHPPTHPPNERMAFSSFKMLMRALQASPILSQSPH